MPFLLFRDTPVDTLTPNVSTLHIDPAHGTSFDFNVKVPGPLMRIGAVRSKFDHDDFFSGRPNVGYETLLYDCMLGDETLFQRADSIETAWAAVDHVLYPDKPLELHGYPAGSAGPKPADDLLAADGRAWRTLTDKPATDNATRSTRKTDFHRQARTKSVHTDIKTKQKTHMTNDHDAIKAERILSIDVGGTGLKATIISPTGEMLSERLRVATPHPAKPDVPRRSPN